MEDGRVIPLRLDLEVSDISGPLTQFQSEKADGAGIKRLVSSLNKVAATPIAEDRLGRLFDPMWPELKEKIEAIPATGSAPKRSRPQSDILEELVAGVRSVEMRVRDMTDEEHPARRRSRRRINPRMLMELSHSISEGPNDPIQLLIVASSFRDDFPWIYELALDVYKCFRSGDHTSAKQAYRRFEAALQSLRHGPLSDIMGSDKLSYMMLMDALEYMRYIELSSSPPRKVAKKNSEAKDEPA